MKFIVLAGGCGSRLWPVSRDTYPKFLMSVNNKDSLLQMTINRLMPKAHPNDILTITNQQHAIHTKTQLDAIYPNMPILKETISKNTAPAIASGLKYWEQHADADEVVAILPSDHLMAPFWDTLDKAYDLAQQGFIVTLGKKPTKPETSFGYIKIGSSFQQGYKCEQFVEKPNESLAQTYYISNEYFWNCGIFIGKISTFLSEFQAHAPDIFSCLQRLSFHQETIEADVYQNMPNISIDYAVMEKSNKIVVVELTSQWDDLGSWESIYNNLPKENNDNVCLGNVHTYNANHCLVYSLNNRTQKQIALIGAHNLVVVDTPDALLVCDKNATQNVKDIYQQIKQTHPEVTNIHTEVLKPWGSYTCLDKGDKYLVKTLSINPYAQLSIQSHQHRSEHWTVLEGPAVVLLKEMEYTLQTGDSIDIPIGVKHSIKNPSSSCIKILETQKGDILSEDDIIRYQDIYGRV